MVINLFYCEAFLGEHQRIVSHALRLKGHEGSLSMAWGQALTLLCVLALYKWHESFDLTKSRAVSS